MLLTQSLAVLLTSLVNFLFKGYLRYKSIFCHKVALDVQSMNSLFEEKMFRSLEVSLDFCDFVKSTDFKNDNIARSGHLPFLNVSYSPFQKKKKKEEENEIGILI